MFGMSCQQFLQILDMIRNLRLHCERDPDAGVDAAKIVVGKPQAVLGSVFMNWKDVAVVRWGHGQAYAQRRHFSPAIPGRG